LNCLKQFKRWRAKPDQNCLGEVYIAFWFWGILK